MKRPKIDLSKEGIKGFFFHHVEKVILGLCVALFGVLFYLGFSSSSYDKSQPDKLVELADAAHRKMLETDNWEEIVDYRQANDTADEMVAIPVDIDPDSFTIGYFCGTPAKTAGLRGDPDFLPVEGLMATSVPMTILVNMTSRDPFAGLSTATAAMESSDEEGGNGGNRSIGSGGGGMLDEDEGSNRGGDDSSRPSRSRRDDGVISPGLYVPSYLADEAVGVRPAVAEVSAGSSRARSYDAVVVTGVVRFKTQWQYYDSVFKSAQGFWPLRDRPIYRLLQIQRAEVDNIDDEVAEDAWEDITMRINYGQPGAYSVNAPEVVDPQAYDAALTGPIPGIINADYRHYSSWPLPGFDVPAGMNTVPARDVFGDGLEEEEELAEQTDDELFGGGGSTNAQDDERGGNRGARGNRGGRTGDRSGMDEERIGSDFSAYEAVAKLTRQPEEDIYKLVRFYDLVVKPGQTYKYRVRAWLYDPNHESPDSSVYEGDSVAGPGRGNERQMGAGGMVGEDPGRGGNGENDDEEEDNFVKVSVQETMLRNEVRLRIREENRPEYPPNTENFSFEDELEFCWHTEWAEVSVEVDVKEEETDEIYAGRIDPARRVRLGQVSVTDGEPIANIAVSQLDDEFNTRVPLLKAARRGDFLSFTGNAHVMHPITMGVFFLENYQSEVDSVVVDIMGGDEVKLGSSRDLIQYSIPGEVLIMGADGELMVSSDLRDRGAFMKEMLQEDDGVESSTVSSNNRGGGSRGGRGGRGGGEFGGNRGGRDEEDDDDF